MEILKKINNRGSKTLDFLTRVRRVCSLLPFVRGLRAHSFLEVRINLHYLGVAILLLVFVVVGYGYIDPDFGYRLKNGELLFNNGFEFFAMTDPYSYTMPSFNFIEHAWGSALLIYLIFSRFGMLGLSFFWSVIALLSLTLSFKTSKTRFYKRLPYGTFFNVLAFFVLTSLVSSFAVRVQVISWFYLSFFLFLYFNERYWKKFRYFVPLLFLLWTNTHGSFIAGIFTFSILTIIKGINLKFPKEFSFGEITRIMETLKLQIDLPDLAVLSVSILATLVNPYGVDIWKKTSGVALSGELRWEVQEWNPTLLRLRITDGLYLVLSLFLIIKKRAKLESSRLYLYSIFFIQGMATARHFPLYLLVSLPITVDALYYFYEDIKQIKFAKERFYTSFKFLSILSAVLFFVHVLFRTQVYFKKTIPNYYPEKAVEYLREDLPEGEIFSLYGWGGYLNWKIPEKKVFVSGFMPLWSRESASEGESLNAYREYTNIIKDKADHKEVFEKYNVEIVLMPANGDERIIDKISKSLVDTYTRSFGKLEGKSLSDRLHEDGWEVIYKDETAGILRKKR